jgi:D-aminoacyl-tRNA deacylase
MLAVVVSRADAASVHIGEHLRAVADWAEHADATRPDAAGGETVFRLGDFERSDGTGDPADAAAPVELREFDERHLETSGVADAFGRVDNGHDRDPDLLVFASRHAGETGALLTAHHTGNFGSADVGGEDRALARACPRAHQRVLRALAERAPEGYEVGMECTHHGPTDVGAPSMFVELGSGPTEWDDPDGARAVARAILDLQGVEPDLPAAGHSVAERATDRRHLVGIGGGHYAPRFERVARETDWAVGHVAADWSLEDLGDPDTETARAVLDAAFEESVATRALVDGDAPGVERAVEDLGYRVVRETWVRETTGVPLGLVATLEDVLGPVEAGTRFGDPARAGGTPADATDRPDDPAVEDLLVASLPGELLAEAQGVDPDETREAVADTALAFETTDNGARAAGRAVFAAVAARERLVDGLADVLADEYEVERTDDAVVARETAFDPGRAHTLGVPEGPAFGKLAAGQSVEVDGETIHPETVRVEREHRFSVWE